MAYFISDKAMKEYEGKSEDEFMDDLCTFRHIYNKERLSEDSIEQMKKRGFSDRAAYFKRKIEEIGFTTDEFIKISEKLHDILELLGWSNSEDLLTFIDFQNRQNKEK